PWKRVTRGVGPEHSADFGLRAPVEGTAAGYARRVGGIVGCMRGTTKPVWRRGFGRDCTPQARIIPALRNVGGNVAQGQRQRPTPVTLRAPTKGSSTEHTGLTSPFTAERNAQQPGRAWVINSEDSDGGHGGPVCCSKLFGSHHLRKRSASPLSAWMPA